MYQSLACLVALLVLGEVAQGITLGGGLKTRAGRRKKQSNRIMATELSCTFVDNPSSICGVRGTLNNYFYGELAGDSIVPNIATCRQFCGNRMPTGGEAGPRCVSFSFDSTSGLCKLYTRRHEEQEFVADPNSDTIHYNSDCISCPSTCPDATGTDNHLENGGFELSDSLAGPWEAKSYSGSLASGGLNSAQAYYCPADDYIHCNLIQYRDLCVGQMYTLTTRFSYQPPAAGNPHGFVNVGTDELFAGLQLGDTTEIGSWQTISYTFQAKNGRSGSLPSVELFTGDSFVKNVGPGQGSGSNRPGIYFDNAIVTPAPDNYTTQGQSLVPNGGFENGAIAPWIYSWTRPSGGEVGNPDGREGNAVVVPQGFAGSSAFRYSGGFLGTVRLQSGSFDMVEGERYLLTFDYRISQFNVFAYIESVENDESTIWGAHWQLGRPAGNEIRSFERVFTAGGTAPCRIRLTAATTDYADTNSIVNLDNVRVRRLA